MPSTHSGTIPTLDQVVDPLLESAPADTSVAVAYVVVVAGTFGYEAMTPDQMVEAIQRGVDLIDDEREDQIGNATAAVALAEVMRAEAKMAAT